MNKKDKEWLIAGSGCLAAGLVMTLITGKQGWFCVGALTGATVVGYRYYENQKVPTAAQKYVRKLLEDRPEFGNLGAPEMPAVDLTPEQVAGTPQSVTKEETEGYAMPFRIPNIEVYIDSSDPRIKPFRTGPLGPENDPVRYW